MQLTDLFGVGDVVAARLIAAGFVDVQSVAEASIEALAAVRFMGRSRAERLSASARGLLAAMAEDADGPDASSDARDESAEGDPAGSDESGKKKKGKKGKKKAKEKKAKKEKVEKDGSKDKKKKKKKSKK
jgi:hypothetical protein